MLPFHHRCFEEFIPISASADQESTGLKAKANQSTVQSNGGLLVLAKGLGEWRVVVQLLRLCCSPQQRPIVGTINPTRPLVLVLNGMSEFAGWRDLCEWWGRVPKNDLPKAINATTLGGKRTGLFAEGGCFFVTTRVLIADLLNGVFKDNLHGLIVLRAHLVKEGSNEAFAIRMVREKNPHCFVRAFCDAPEKLSSGFARLQGIMSALQVRALFLYPRFRQEIRDDLDASNVEVIELAQPLSDAMREIQSALVECIKTCVEEVRRSASLDVSDLSVESALFKPFDMVLRAKLLPDWSSVSLKTKQLVDDLQVLRTLVKDLLTLDCVSFYGKLMDCKKKAAESSLPSVWLLTDAGDRLFRFAKARVYKFDNNTSNLTVVLEPMLKIEALRRVLKEIQAKQATDKKLKNVMDLFGGTDVVILVKEESSLSQVANILAQDSSKQMPVLERRFLNFLGKTVGPLQTATAEQTVLQSEMLRLQKRKMSFPTPPALAKKADANFHPKSCFVAEVDEPEIVPRNCQIAVHLISDLWANGLLDLLRPRFVVLFEPDAAAMREVECYRAIHKTPVTLYMVYFENSIEEQRHLSALNQERDAFLRLIQEKSELVFGPSTTPDAEKLAQQQMEESISMVFDATTGQMVPATKRKRGSNVQANKVIVDLRELRSTLPNMLHGSGFTLDARTLEVGDYILSPELCVERKAIPDLIDSLKSGRLFKQCTMMTRHYKRPVLLIEFPDAGPFRLVSPDTYEMTQVAIMSNLALLTYHFPDLRIVWSKSQRATVDIFRELQKNQLPPDGALAESFEATGAGRLMADVPNVEAVEMLKRMPGITKDNVYRVARGAGTLAELCNMDLDQLTELCEGATNARLLYTFLHEQ